MQNCLSYVVVFFLFCFFLFSFFGDVNNGLFLHFSNENPDKLIMYCEEMN